MKITNYRLKQMIGLAILVKFLLLSFQVVAQEDQINAVTEPDRSEVITVRFPRVDDAKVYQEQANYFFELLKLALSNADHTFDLEIVPIPIMSLSRSMLNIQNNVYDVHWAPTSFEREEALQPIRIPLLKGIIGLRIALVNETNKNAFSEVQKFEELRRYAVGQGHDWIDTKILKAYGLRVLSPISNTSLYGLLNRERIDFFPRSVMEVWFEHDHINDDRISIDQYIALYYALPTYFFVRKDQELLHKQLLLGLNRAIEDGSFETLFQRYFLPYLDKANLGQRRIFVLDNPFLPEKTPLEREELWFQPPKGQYFKVPLQPEVNTPN